MELEHFRTRNFHFTYEMRTDSRMKYLMYMKWTGSKFHVKFLCTKQVFHVLNGNFTYEIFIPIMELKHFTYEIVLSYVKLQLKFLLGS